MREFVVGVALQEHFEVVLQFVFPFIDELLVVVAEKLFRGEGGGLDVFFEFFVEIVEHGVAFFELETLLVGVSDLDNVKNDVFAGFSGDEEHADVFDWSLIHGFDFN